MTATEADDTTGTGAEDTAATEADATGEGRTPDLEQMFQTGVRAFQLAAEEEWICKRLAHTGTTCAWKVSDTELGLTALLDRSPIEVAEEAQDDAEIQIYGGEEAWLSVFSGETHLGMALARGELEWTGPVRKFLVIFPIFRRAYRDAARED